MNVEDLKAKAVSANKAYRSGTAVISDAEYDAVLDEIRRIYAAAGKTGEFEIFKNSLHEAPGKVKNEFVLGSLNKLKIQEPASIFKFIEQYVESALNVSAKVDGISCRVRYVGGKLVSANTRGDGYFGEDLTDKIFLVKGVPHEIAGKETIDVRGELVILKDDFAKMGCGKNSRNVCAGIMNRKRSSKEWNDDDLRAVSFVPYTVLDGVRTKAEQFKLLEDLGFSTPWHVSIPLRRVKDPGFDVVAELRKYATQDLPYAIDGVVVSDDLYRNENKYRPDAQMAVKANTMEAETVLLDVEWEGPSKDGVLAPVAVVEPVDLGDSCISRATLHNLDYIGGIGLKCGSRVMIVKAGDVIPKITSCVFTPDGASDIEIPSECPCCHGELERDGVNMRCVNPDCRAQKIYRIMHFIKKLGVMNVSYKTLDSFGVDSFESLLRFSPDRRYKSETKFYDELYDKVFSRSEQDLFCAMNMRGLGETLQRKIIDHYGWDFVKGAAESKRLPDGGLPSGIGQTTFDKFVESCGRNLSYVGMIAGDARYHCDGHAVPAKAEKLGSVCFTGALNAMGRAQAAKLAENAGYEVKTSVSKGLTYLVTNDAESGSSKNEKARKLGTKIINEEQFLEIVNKNKVKADIDSL